MNEYYNLIIRCLLFYVMIIFYLRMMGKREVGELSVFDLVLYFLMTELLAISINSVDDSIWKTIVPVTLLAALQIILAWILLKNKKMRDWIEGRPAILIKHGVIQQKEMRKHRYTIDDLLFQIRDCDVSSVSEVEFAILENSGVLSVLKKDSCNVQHPFPLVSDGEFIDREIEAAQIDKEWLKEQLKQRGHNDETTVFLCLLEKDRLFVVKKQD